MLNKLGGLKTLPGDQVNLGGVIARSFLHFSGGIKYTVSLGSAATQARAVIIKLDGQSIDSVLKRFYRVVLNDYISNGNEGWKGVPILAGLTPSIIGLNIKALSAGLSNSPAGSAAGGLGGAAVVEGNAVPVAPKGPLRRALGVAVDVAAESWLMGLLVGLFSAAL